MDSTMYIEWSIRNFSHNKVPIFGKKQRKLLVPSNFFDQGDSWIYRNWVCMAKCIRFSAFSEILAIVSVKIYFIYSLYTIVAILSKILLLSTAIRIFDFKNLKRKSAKSSECGGQSKSKCGQQTMVSIKTSIVDCDSETTILLKPEVLLVISTDWAGRWTWNSPVLYFIIFYLSVAEPTIPLLLQAIW